MANGKENTNNADETAKITSDNVDDSQGSGGGSDESNPQSKKKPSILDIPEEFRDIANSLIGTARKQGVDKGKRLASNDKQKQEHDTKVEDLKDKKDYKGLSSELENRLSTVQTELEQSNYKLLAIEVAIEKGIPEPLKVYKRLQGDTREELEEDADQLLSVLKISSPKQEEDKSKEPPPTPPPGPTRRVSGQSQDEEADMAAAQFASPIYNV